MVALAAATSAGAIAAGVPRVPLSAFFDYPTVADPQISPDGTRIAYIAPYQGRTAVALYTIGHGPPEVAEAPTDGNVYSIQWKGKDHLLYAGMNDQYETSMLISLNLKEHDVTRLVRGYAGNAADFYTLDDDPDHIAVAGGALGFGSGVYKLDIRNDHFEVIRTTFGATDHPYTWILDNAGVVRIEGRVAADRGQGESISWYYRAARGTPFEKLVEYPIAATTWYPLFFAPDNQTLYVYSYQASDTGVLRTYDCRTHRLGPTVFDSASGEVDGYFTARDGRLLGVSYVTDREHVHWLDPHMRAIQAGIDAALPGTIDSVVSYDDALDRFIIEAWSDREPGVYYLLDIKRHTLSPIGTRRPGIRPQDMAPMQPISFTARDGLLIHGYLTLPLNAGHHPVPLILLPHGGPAARDVWGFDPEVQFLANRGYGVLQVNFRGSTGYGEKLFRAGIGQWGRKMQDDLTDAVKWAEARGIADPRRVCIYGASYGGYAALMGLEFTPQLYKCGVNYAGVVNPAQIAFGALSYSFISRYYDELFMGGDKAVLKRYSPINYVQNIRVPTLHAYGGNDPRVDIHEWKDLRRKLKEYHKKFSYLDLPYEGHGFRLQQDRITFYRTLENFLQKNL